MFETLSKGFRAARNRLTGVTELDEANLEPALRDVRLSLLEADVELGVVKRFLERVKTKIVGETIQNEVYAVGKEHGFDPLRAWFAALYEVLLGQTQGPRFGSFAAIYGLPQTIALIEAGAEGRLA